MILPFDDEPFTDQERNDAITSYCAAVKNFREEASEENFTTLQWATDHANECGVLKMAEAALMAGEKVFERVN
jgi:hypothetical protein